MKRTAWIAVIILLCVLCSGCDAWMSGEYLSVTPHEAQTADYADRVIEVTSYTQLRNAVENIVRTGSDNGIISISAFNKGTIHFYVDTAISNVIENTAFGSYAVEKITYEIGTNRGVSVVACKVHYRPGYRHPSQIRQITDAQQLSEAVIEALEGLDKSLLIYMEQYEKLDIEQLVRDYAAQYPERIVEYPEVTVHVYPEKGAERIVEIAFGYQTDQVVLQQMRSKVAESLSGAEGCVRGLTDATEIYGQLFSYLTENYRYTSNTSQMPLYQVLVKGEGNEQALSEVYQLLCARVAKGCKTITGTKDGKPWTWNAVQIRGRYYEVDLLQCLNDGVFSLLTDEQLSAYQAS